MSDKSGHTSRRALNRTSPSPPRTQTASLSSECVGAKTSDWNGSKVNSAFPPFRASEGAGAHPRAPAPAGLKGSLEPDLGESGLPSALCGHLISRGDFRREQFIPGPGWMLLLQMCRGCVLSVFLAITLPPSKRLG